MKTRISKDHWLLTQKCAHRGLHGNGVSENSLKAFSLAVEEGYPIEFDVQMTADKELFVVHDENMTRLCSVDRDIRDMTKEEVLSTLTLSDGQKIPTFKEVLDLVKGRVPLLIEIKSQKQKGIESRAISLLSGYNGQFVIQSFDPFVMLNVKKIDKNIIRGQLGGVVEGQTKKVAFVVKNLPFNFLVRPDFINYDIGHLDVAKKRSGGLPLLGWTVRSDADRQKAEKYCDGFVFENVRP